MNQGELAAHCPFIGLKCADFNSQCLSNAKYLFSETLSPKNHGQVSFDKKGYHDAVLVSFTATPPNITTTIHTREKTPSLSSIRRKDFPTKSHLSFGVTY